MAHFTVDGERWPVVLDTRTLARIRHGVGADPLGLLVGDESATEAFGDPVTLVDALEIACRDTIAERGIESDQFARMLVGDALGDAASAFTDALLDFVPCPKRRAMLRAATKAGATTTARIADRAVELLEQAEREISGATSTAPQEPSA